MDPHASLPQPPTRRLLIAAALVAFTAFASAATRRYATPPAHQMMAQPAPAPPPAPPPAPLTTVTAGPVSLRGQLDRSAVQVGGDGLVRMELVLTGARTEPTVAGRMPTDFVVLLDRSGSMDGDKIVHARAAIRELIGQLTDDDRFALLTYSDAAQIVLPLAVVTPAARAQWLTVVDRVTTDGGTNMASGIDLALSTLGASHAARGTARIMLISDGLANQGDATKEGLVGRVVRAARSEYTLTAVGVGDDFNEELMTALADAGTGNYYYVQRATDLGNVFAREFGAARSTVASAVAIEIDPASGVQVVDAAGYPLEHEGSRIVFRPGALFSGQERRIWVTLAVPHDTPAEHALGTFGVAYTADNTTHRLTLTDAPRIACVAAEQDFLASVDVPTWERAVSVEAYNKMEQEVARKVKDGRKDEAREAVKKFRAEAGTLNAHIKSPVVQQKLDALKDLEAHVNDAFEGADQRAKQNTLSKSRGAAAYDSRRLGAKY